MNTTTSRTPLFVALLSAAFCLSGPLRAAPEAKPQVIQETGNDSMKYSVTEITAKPGEALEVTMTNIGQLPKNAMSHNWVLLKSSTDEEIAAFAGSAASKPPTYMPADTSIVLAHTKMLGPKETDKVAFTAPTAPGTYPFICTFPGHFMLMRGKLIVK